MTDKELKKKIVGILKEAYMPKYHGEPTIYYCIDDEYAPEVYYPTDEDVADALIAEGLKLDDMTETDRQRYNAYKIIEPQIKGCLDREKNLEKRLAEAEHRAEVAEKALDLCETAYVLAINGMKTHGISLQAITSDLGVHGFFMRQAEKELAEERKDD